jgi:hypothetical protein
MQLQEHAVIRGHMRWALAVTDKLQQQDAELEQLRTVKESQAKQLAMPDWDRATGKLTIAGTLAKQIRNLAQKGQPTNVVRILDAFTELGWPDRIDDPLPGVSLDSDRNRRLTSAVESLNDRISGMRFCRDGTADGIRWERA